MCICALDVISGKVWRPGHELSRGHDGEQKLTWKNLVQVRIWEEHGIKPFITSFLKAKFPSNPMCSTWHFSATHWWFYLCNPIWFMACPSSELFPIPRNLNLLRAIEWRVREKVWSFGISPQVKQTWKSFSTPINKINRIYLPRRRVFTGWYSACLSGKIRSLSTRWPS